MIYILASNSNKSPYSMFKLLRQKLGSGNAYIAFNRCRRKRKDRGITVEALFSVSRTVHDYNAMPDCTLKLR